MDYNVFKRLLIFLDELSRISGLFCFIILWLARDNEETTQQRNWRPIIKTLPAKTNLIFNLQFREVRNYPWKIECFLEDLFLGGQSSIILGYRRLSVKSLLVQPSIPRMKRPPARPIVNEISVITFGLLLVNLANFFFLAGQQLQKRQKSNGSCREGNSQEGNRMLPEKTKPKQREQQ